MKVLDLFSGIGGFSLGLERAGMETVAFCEFDRCAQKVLKKHWPEVPIFDDVRTLDGKQFRGTVELICGGYPCQPFSVAGERRGEEDDRHLWPEYLRLIKEVRPAWVLAENVTGHINLGLDKVLSDLEGEGYSWECFIIPAVSLNAHHRRDRVWIVAHSDMSGRREGDEEVAGEVSKQLNSGGFQSIEADTNSDNIGLQGCAEESIPRVSDLQSKLVRGGEAIGILPDASQPGILGITNGFPGRVDRIKQLGNAVVPAIPEAIGRAIVQAEKDLTSE